MQNQQNESWFLLTRADCLRCCFITLSYRQSLLILIRGQKLKSCKSLNFMVACLRVSSWVSNSASVLGSPQPSGPLPSPLYLLLPFCLIMAFLIGDSIPPYAKVLPLHNVHQKFVRLKLLARLTDEAENNETSIGISTLSGAASSCQPSVSRQLSFTQHSQV